ncbi:MAG: pyridoxal-phosphate dependent enzyme [Clostridia bacterium]
MKDRAAAQMIQERKKRPFEGRSVIIEPTSGNTGIGRSIAALKATERFHQPETMSVERRNILKAYGAEIVLTEGAKYGGRY